MATSHAFVFEQFGKPESALKWTEVPKPEVQSDTQVLVRVIAAPINPSDAGVVGGWYQPENVTFPSQTGLEGVGIVEEVRNHALGVKVGQRVHFRNIWQSTSSWAEYALIDTAKGAALIPVPDGVSDTAAAQLTVNPITVSALMAEVGAKKGDFLLQNAAGSSLGRLLIQFAKIKGIKTINVVRREEQVAELLALGADYVINSAKEDVAERVKALTEGKGVKYALDSVSGKAGETLIDSLAIGGKVIIFGALSAEPLTLAPQLFVFKGLSVAGFWLYLWFHQTPPAQVKAAYEEWFELLKTNAIELKSKTFQAKTQLLDALAHSTTPGKAEKTILLF